MNKENEFEGFEPLLVIFITLAGGWLRVLLLDSKGLWLDEAFSVWLANHGVGDMLQWIIRIDQHPPLYYLLLHYWVALFGDTPYDIRLLSVLFGAATIPVIYLIGKRMSGAGMGLAAAVFLALSPFNILFAQETRMYTLLAFNAAVAIYALVRLLADPRAARPIGSQFREFPHAWRAHRAVEPGSKEDFRYPVEPNSQTGWRAWISRHRWFPIQAIETDLAWIAFIVFSAATLYTHNTAVLFPLAVNIFILGLMLFQRIRKTGPQPAFQAPSFGNWVKSQIGILLLWSPWILPFIKQASGVYQEFWLPAPTWDTVFGALRTFVNCSVIGQSGQVTVMWVLYALVLCFALVHYRKKMSQFLFLAALFAIPFLGELFVSIWRPVFYPKTLIWITIPLFLALAAGIAQLRFRFVILTALGIFGAYNIFTTADNFRFLRKEDWNTAAGYIANFAEKDDLVLFNASWVQIPFDYYFKAYEQQYHLQVEKRGVPLDLFENDILEPKMTEGDIPGLVSLLEGRKRVWLVYSHDSYTDPAGIIPRTMASKLKLTRQRDFYGGVVQLYESP